jgi:hypothetical protein
MTIHRVVESGFVRSVWCRIGMQGEGDKELISIASNVMIVARVRD